MLSDAIDASRYPSTWVAISATTARPKTRPATMPSEPAE